MANSVQGDPKLPVLAAGAPVSRDEVASRLGRRDFVLVDVLSADSFASVHIRGALSLPLAELPDRAAEVLPDRAAEIVVYCGGFT